MALTEIFHTDTDFPSIAVIVIFNIIAMNVSVFLYAYYVYVLIYRGRCQLKELAYSI